MPDQIPLRGTDRCQLLAKTRASRSDPSRVFVTRNASALAGNVLRASTRVCQSPRATVMEPLRDSAGRKRLAEDNLVDVPALLAVTEPGFEEAGGGPVRQLGCATWLSWRVKCRH
jgi:hypothetical protein